MKQLLITSIFFFLLSGASAQQNFSGKLCLPITEAEKDITRSAVVKKSVEENENLQPGDQLLADSELELSGSGQGQWTSTSSSFGTSFCDSAACGTVGGSMAPRSGKFYIWFGGTALKETGTLQQTFTVNEDVNTSLSFWYKNSLRSTGNTSTPASLKENDSIMVYLDNELIVKLDYSTPASTDYVEYIARVFVGAGEHTIKFIGYFSPSERATNFAIDDITLTVVDDGTSKDEAYTEDNIGIWVSGGMLYVYSSIGQSAVIYNAAGRKEKEMNVMVGMNSTELSKGVYIVKTSGGDSVKVIVQ